MNIINNIYNVKKIAFIKRIIVKERKIIYVLGRFKVFRNIYSTYRYLKQILSLQRGESDQKTYFEKVSVELVIKSIKKYGVFIGISLPKDIREEIKYYAYNTYFSREDGLAYFYYSDVKNGYLQDGRPVPQAVAVEPLKCNAIKKIVYDSIIIEIVSKYLKYYPTRYDVFLRWSFLIDLPNETRMQLYQTVKYHYDIWGFNSIFVNFYLLKTDVNSGAHAMIKFSHNHKKIMMLLNSAIQPAQTLYNYYGKYNEIIIEGGEGYGFIQDPHCYHKALPPVNGERLMLQIRYY